MGWQSSCWKQWRRLHRFWYYTTYYIKLHRKRRWLHFIEVDAQYCLVLSKEEVPFVVPGWWKLVLYKKNNGPLRESKTFLPDPWGNLVLYRSSGEGEHGDPYWHTGANGNHDAKLYMHDVRKAVIYNTRGTPIWSTKTYEGSPVNPFDNGNGGDKLCSPEKRSHCTSSVSMVTIMELKDHERATNWTLMENCFRIALGILEKVNVTRSNFL